MRKIVRARLKPFGGSAEFISMKGKIKSIIEKNKGDVFHFVMEDEGVKTVKEFGPENIDSDDFNKLVELGILPIENGVGFVIFKKD